MLIPHLHFGGNCKEVIDLYERAFNTKANAESFDYTPDGEVAHASMIIHGVKVFLNDALKYFSDTAGNISWPVHLIITFDTPDELLACYEILKEDGDLPIPFQKTLYSKLVGNFTDRVGVLWGFMVVEQ